MPRRTTPGGHIYHVFNRAIEGLDLFERPEDYFAFERLLAEACEHVTMRILAYCLMPNHWHLVLWPYEDGDLSKFMHWLCTIHVRRWRRHRDSRGHGHIYQSPFKSFPVERNHHGLRLCRYVERNALTANLVRRAEDWRWGSLHRRLNPDLATGVPPLFGWPGGLPKAWVARVNEPQTQKEVNSFARSFAKGRPFGSPEWEERVAKELGLESTLRNAGRPRTQG